MKPKSITRTELHRLVWTEPRSKLAPIWEISDVALGKLCVRAHIPAPPPGYWAKKAAGGRTRITPLPIRQPGQRELVELRQLSHYERWNEAIDLEIGIAPPAYAETIEEIVEAALKLVGPYRAERDLSAPHRGLRRVLRSEFNRAEKQKERNWTFDAPRYSLPRFQRQLRIFSSVFLILDPLHADCEVREGDSWIQGHGHVHHLVASVGIGDSRLQLQFLEPENPKNSKELPRAAVITLRIGAGEKCVDFADDADEKIERRLVAIIKTVLELAEKQMRSSDQSAYERKLERREQLLKEVVERKRKEEELRLAAIQARKEAIRKEVSDAAENLRRAMDIRQLVEHMANHPDCLEEGKQNYLAWAEVALAEADALDPMKHPISKVFTAWSKDA
jgi:hypothetical protein